MLFSFKYSDGVKPVIFLKFLLNEVLELKPHSKANESKVNLRFSGRNQFYKFVRVG